MKKSHRTILLTILALITLAVPNLAALTWTDQAQFTTESKDCLALLDRLKSQSDSPDTALARGILYHNLARNTPQDWAGKAVAALKPLAESSALAQAWYGSALTLKGGLAQTQKNLVDATTFTDQGMAAIDAALAREPDNQSIRTLRIENSIAVSKDSPYKRWDQVQADVTWFKARSGLDAPAQALLAYWQAQLALSKNQINQAFKFLDQALRLAPDSSGAAQARRLLAELED